MSGLCVALHAAFASLPRLRFPFENARIPKNGLYILFEEGETAHETDRIVRIGTHTGQDQLPSRLKQHFLKENKDRSIFRKNIGRALLNRESDPFLEQWEIDLTTRDAKQKFSSLIDQEKLQATERRVTAYIQNHFQFVVLSVKPKDQRLLLESRIISTVSRCLDCQPSPYWLGHHSPIDKIRQSGLWLVNELYKKPFTTAELDEFLLHLSPFYCT